MKDGQTYTHKTNEIVDKCRVLSYVNGVKTYKEYPLLYTATLVSSCGFLGLGGTYYMTQDEDFVSNTGIYLSQACTDIKINNAILANGSGNGDLGNSSNWTEKYYSACKF